MLRAVGCHESRFQPVWLLRRTVLYWTVCAVSIDQSPETCSSASAVSSVNQSMILSESCLKLTEALSLSPWMKQVEVTALSLSDGRVLAGPLTSYTDPVLSAPRPPPKRCTDAVMRTHYLYLWFGSVRNLVSHCCLSSHYMTSYWHSKCFAVSVARIIYVTLHAPL